MQISQKTLSILKNFATINDRILIEPGQELNIVKSALLGRATVTEQFPVQVGIYSLSNFLKVIGLFKSACCDFQDAFVHIREADGDAQVRYNYCDPSLINARIPKRLSNPPSECIQFDLPESKWAALQKAASVLDKQEVRILSDGSAMSITTYNHRYSGGSEFSTPLVGDPYGRQCNMIFQLENLKLLQGSYHATLTQTYAVFKNTSGYDLTYWVGCDPESTFE